MQPTSSACSEQQFHNSYPPGIEHKFWNLARNMVIADTLRGIGADTSKILEVGCGTGIVVSYLRKQGMDCTGAELGNPTLVPDIKDHVVTGRDYRDLPQHTLESVETLLLLDVIEHIEAPVPFLKEARSLMPNLRRILITVPARKEVWSNYDDYNRHFRRYNRQDLKSELSSAGFEIEKNFYFFHSLYFVLLALSLFRVDRAIQFQAPKRKGLHAFIARCFKIESRVLPGFILGSSLLATAKPKPAQ
ncbi:MAG: class I SAM-dependent methyltransferase [Rhodospirillales bacterium]|nr:class I SAM-dependent methyltransferase [Rhodospirillales bacterium]